MKEIKRNKTMLVASNIMNPFEHIFLVRTTTATCCSNSSSDRYRALCTKVARRHQAKRAYRERCAAIGWLAVHGRQSAHIARTFLFMFLSLVFALKSYGLCLILMLFLREALLHSENNYVLFFLKSRKI